VFDPKGGYFKAGGVYMPSLVAELGSIVEDHLKSIGMMHDPEILILDEPTAGADVELRRDLWLILDELNKQGKTIFLTTHYLEEAEKLCGRIGIIFNGKIVALESKEELIKDGKRIEDHYLHYAELERNGANV